VPAVSEAQRRLMWWARSNPKASGIKPSISKEFTDSDPGGKLPARVKDGKPMKKERKWGSLG
jgi:hypothetical protein